MQSSKLCIFICVHVSFACWGLCVCRQKCKCDYLELRGGHFLFTCQFTALAVLVDLYPEEKVQQTEQQTSTTDRRAAWSHRCSTSIPQWVFSCEGTHVVVVAATTSEADLLTSILFILDQMKLSGHVVLSLILLLASGSKGDAYTCDILDLMWCSL